MKHQRSIRTDPKKAAHALWRAGLLDFLLWPQQIPIYNGIRSLPNTVDLAVVLTARQFGKSVLGAILALEDCLQNPNKCILMVGPTERMAREIIAPRIAMLARNAPEGLITRTKSESKWNVGHSEIVIGGFDQNSSSHRGKTLHNIYVEEVVDSNPDQYMESMRSDLGPALTHSDNGKIIILTTPPKTPDHPFITHTVPEAASNSALFRFTIYDNKKISKEQFERCVKLAGGIDSVDFKREYLCEVVRDGSLVLVPEFNEDLVVKPCAAPQHSIFWVSGDTGGVRDKHVFHLMTYDFLRNKYLFLDERAFDPDTSTADMIPKLLDMEGGRKIAARWVDAAGQLQVDLMRYWQYTTTLPRKDDLDATVNQVRRAIQCGEVEIDPKCQLLITTMRSGTYNRTRTDLERTRTLGHCDAFMSAAYGLRHAITSNPFPKFGDARPHTHYIDREDKRNSKSAYAIKSIYSLR